MTGWIGIDPGATGAIAIIWGDTDVDIHDWPGDERALDSLLIRIADSCTVECAVLEYQQAMPGQGVTSMFKLGVNYGMWLSAIAARQWPLKIVRPSCWKKGFGYPPKEKADGKQHSLTLARQMYPQAARLLARKKDHNRAEALLLAHYAKEGKFEIEDEEDFLR